MIDALVAQAASAGDAVMPSYTHVRRAQPVLVAHYLLAHAHALRRDVDRFEAVRAEADAMPLGAGAIAGTNYAVDTKFLAQQLGFTKVVANSIDATSDRDYVSSFLHASSLAMVHLSRLAEDVVLFTGEEFGFFVLSDAVATGSSLMPQKKNPDPMELVRGKSGRTIGHLTGMLTTMKGLPSGYNKDLQEDKEAVFDTEDTLMGSAGAAATVVRTLTLDRARTTRGASGFLLSTDVADYLVSKGVAFRTAHEVVGGMVRELLKQGQGVRDADAGGVARVQPGLRRGRDEGGHRAGLGAGEEDAAVHESRRGAGAACRDHGVAEGGAVAVTDKAQPTAGHRGVTSCRSRPAAPGASRTPDAMQPGLAPRGSRGSASSATAPPLPACHGRGRCASRRRR